jgi:hypothetical protein
MTTKECSINSDISKHYLNSLKGADQKNGISFKLELENKTYILIILLTTEYHIYLFEKLDQSKYYFILYRDINLKKEELSIDNFSLKVKYNYEGSYLIVSHSYRKLDLSLFSFYVYGLILNYVEKILQSDKKNQIYQMLLNASVITKDRGHQHCPYCSFYTPTCFIEKKGVWKRLPNFKFKSYRNKGWNNAGCRESTTHFHSLIPSRDETLLNKVLKKFKEKKNQTLGVNLIQLCQDKRII